MKIRGRDEEVLRLTNDALAGRFVIVSGAAGIGTTTVLTQGVGPSLRAAGCIAVYHNEWQSRSFSTQLKEAAAQAVRDPADAAFLARDESLEEMLHRIRNLTGRPAALLLDQFEEYLRFHPAGGALADEFDAELARAVNSRSAVFVVGLQEHAVSALDRLSHLIPDLLEHRLHLPPIAAAAARDIVLDMAREEAVAIDDSVADSFANARTAALGGGVHPWLLVQGVTRLLQAAAASKPPAASAPTVEALGGPDRLILESLDAEIERLNLSHKEVLFRWCDVLISPANHRMAATEGALAERAGDLARFGKTLLPILLGNGILRAVEVGGASRYELSREPLTIVLKDWWTRRESASAARRRAKFRVRSMSIAAGAIAASYVVWLWMNWK